MKKTIFFAFLLSLLFGTTSCVHEWPEVPEGRKVLLTLTHQNTEWGYIYHDITRTSPAKAPGVGVRYIVQVYPHGDVSHLVTSQTFYSPVPVFEDYTAELTLPVGEFDIYVWNDYVNSSTKEPLGYDVETFANISYLEPYSGNTDLKDCFRGNTTVSIPASIEQDIDLHYYCDLGRPITAYAFLAKDLREFVQTEVTRRRIPDNPTPGQSTEVSDNEAEVLSRIPDFKGYKVMFYYSGYLPTRYNIFDNAPRNAVTGITFYGGITEINSDTALLGYDMFFINGQESKVTVGLIVYDPEGNQVASVSPVNIPVEKNHCTIVTGDFLTAAQKPGIGIDPSFGGSYDIIIE